MYEHINTVITPLKLNDEQKNEIKNLLVDVSFDDFEKLEKIKKIIYNNMKKNDISPVLQELLGEEKIMFRNFGDSQINIMSNFNRL